MCILYFQSFRVILNGFFYISCFLIAASPIKVCISIIRLHLNNPWEILYRSLIIMRSFVADSSIVQTMHVMRINTESIIIIGQSLLKLTQFSIAIPLINYLRSIVKWLDIRTRKTHFLSVTVHGLLIIIIFPVKKSKVWVYNRVSRVELDGTFKILDRFLNTELRFNLFIWRRKQPLLCM